MAPWPRVKAVLAGLMAAASLAAASAEAGAQPPTGVLHVTVRVGPAGGAATAGGRHVLLVSDNPPSRSPWRIVTAPDGTGKVTLPQGNYTVESDAPLIFDGRTYEWRQIIDVPAGGTPLLELTAANAEVGEARITLDTPGAPQKTDPWELLVRWQDSLVAVWTPTTHAAGVVLSRTGLIATTQRVVAGATRLDVQISPALKVAAQVLAADEARNVAILRIDPTSLGTREAVPITCEGTARPVVDRGQAISAIGLPLRRQPTTTTGTVIRLDASTLGTVFDLPPDSSGGPVFASDGAFIGLTSVAALIDGAEDPETTVVRVDAMCDVLAVATTAAATAAPPTATPRPVEPTDVVTEDVLRAAVQERRGSLEPPRVSSSSFEIDVISPVVAFAGMQASMDFGQWTRYVADHPGVLLLRVAPKLSESLWMKVARGAALTQGIALPPIKRYEPGFARMRVLCGKTEVVPIHPFLVQRRVSETSAIREGLYVLAPDALGPHCGAVTLEVFSEKAPDTRESVSLDATLLQRLWDELAPYRRQPPPTR